MVNHFFSAKPPGGKGLARRIQFGIGNRMCKLKLTLSCPLRITPHERSPVTAVLSAQEQAVVIGAGMGGLAAAIRLAAAGVAVTVIDMAEGPGGKARALPSPAGPIATGPTVLTMPQHAAALFALCGTRIEDELDLVALPRLARHYWPDGSMLDLFPDPLANEDAIRALCGPREASAFRRFNRLSAGLMAAFAGPMMHSARPALLAVAAAALRRPRVWPALLPGVSIDRLLRHHFRDPRLVQLFGRYATYVGGRPTHTPAVLSLVWQAEQAGVWALRDGLHGLAGALARVAAARGVTFRYATRARRIRRQSGHVTGVEIEGSATLPCTTCVFNGDPRALQEGMLGDAARAALPSARATPSLSAWVWAFAAQAQGLDLAHHSVFFTADPDLEFGPVGEGRMPVAPTLYLCAQDRELGLPLPDLERFEIILNGPAGHPAQASEEHECRNRTFPVLKAQGLTFSPAPPPTALTTPAQLAQRYPGSQGAIYGASPEGLLAAFRRPQARTALPGLYLAGGGTHPGAGVPMALLSGQHAATAWAEDRISGLRLAPADMPGGMLTGSRTTGPAQSR
jgi:1-hydroxycarotenoid 3,4-desaturase